MKAASINIAPPEPRMRTAAPAQLSFKSALADAERLIERPAMFPDRSSHGARGDDPNKRAPSRMADGLAARIEIERNPRDKLESGQLQTFGSHLGDQPRDKAPERAPALRAGVAEEGADYPAQSSITGPPEIRTRRSEIHSTATGVNAHLTSLSASSPTDAECSIEPAAAEKRIAASPIDAERSLDALERTVPRGMRLIEWSARRTPFEQAGSSSPPGDSAWGLARRATDRSIAWTLTQAHRPKDDGQQPLGFAEPGVIRPLRCNIERRSAYFQKGSMEEPRAAAARANHIEYDRRAELGEGGDRPSQRTQPPKMEATPRQAMAQRILRFAFVHPLSTQVPMTTGVARFVAPDGAAQEAVASSRLQSAKARLPRPQSPKQHSPSLIFRDAAGALEVIVGLPSATPDLRARLQRAFDALAAEYGLRIAHMTLNGASVGRGTRGG